MRHRDLVASLATQSNASPGPFLLFHHTDVRSTAMRAVGSSPSCPTARHVAVQSTTAYSAQSLLPCCLVHRPVLSNPVHSSRRCLPGPSPPGLPHTVFATCRAARPTVPLVFVLRVIDLCRYKEGDDRRVAVPLTPSFVDTLASHPRHHMDKME